MKAIDLANYIVSKQINEQNYTNTISLQKLLYFVNAKFMKYKNKPQAIFSDSLQKWKYGPVNPEVYKEYRMYGALEITSLPTFQSFFWDEEDFLDEINNELGIDKSLLDDWINEFVDTERFKLVDITHEHLVWKKDSRLIESGKQNIIYDYEEIYNEMMLDANKFFKGSEEDE